ncbi:hypothetical protein KR222_003085 [Zaprionus bogoriensis]|nr:hypothetical protein KR222_003085 [Zaprionus bogoriensis]
MPVVDLTVDRNLLCPNFDGYKLSFDAVPVQRQSCQRNPLQLQPHSQQYSLLHVELFARHNLLASDPWARYNSYYVNAQHEVLLCAYDEQHGQPRPQRVVYSIEQAAPASAPGDYNYSLRFISEKYCVLCDGGQQLQLLDTGDRERATPWKRIASTPIQPDAAQSQRGYLLYDARLDVLHERKQISLLLGHVARQRDAHIMQLTWSHWTQQQQQDAGMGPSWSYCIREQLQTRGSVYYCAFEPRAESLIFCSSGELQTQQQAELERLSLAVASEHSWTQTPEELLLRLPLSEALHQREQLSVSCTSGQLRVAHGAQTLLQGKLYAAVQQELMHWTTLEREQEQEAWELQLTLHKQQKEQHWPSLFAKQEEQQQGQQREQETEQQQLDTEKEQQQQQLDQEEQQTSEMEHEQLPIPNLEEPVEDCDLPLTADSADIKMVRFNLSEGAITHTIFLGATPPLFASSLRPGYPAAFATRQGVDASVWLQRYQPARPGEWSVRHEGNLHAFGYVQASKQQRKFIDCCPELEYAVIAESHRHVFVYKGRHDSAGGLRNRNGPQVVIGKQLLVTLEEDVGEVLGMATAPGVVTLLTAHAVLYLQV